MAHNNYLVDTRNDQWTQSRPDSPGHWAWTVLRFEKRTKVSRGERIRRGVDAYEGGQALASYDVAYLLVTIRQLDGMVYVEATAEPDDGVAEWFLTEFSQTYTARGY